MATVHDIRLFRLHQLFEEFNGVAGLARHTGASENYLRQITGKKSKRNLGSQLARELEAATDKPKGWMDTMEVSEIIENDLFGVPFYNFDDLARIDELEPVRKEPFPASNLSEGAFATQFFGDSMIPASGLGVLDGSIVIVEPALKPATRSIVLALVDGKPLIRQYKKEGADILLSPLNQHNTYKSIELGEGKIIGVIRHTKTTFG